MRMQHEEDIASRSGRNFDMDKYYGSTKPGLMWSRAQEFLALNMRNRAINDMGDSHKNLSDTPQRSRLGQPGGKTGESARGHCDNRERPMPAAAVPVPVATPDASAAATPPTDIQQEPAPLHPRPCRAKLTGRIAENQGFARGTRRAKIF